MAPQQQRRRVYSCCDECCRWKRLLGRGRVAAYQLKRRLHHLCNGCNQYRNVVDWLDQNRTEGCTAATMTAFATQGHIKGVRWCLEIGRPLNAVAIKRAVLNGHFEIAWLLHPYGQRTRCNVIRALNECTY